MLNHIARTPIYIFSIYNVFIATYSLNFCARLMNMSINMQKRPPYSGGLYKDKWTGRENILKLQLPGSCRGRSAAPDNPVPGGKLPTCFPGRAY